MKRETITELLVGLLFAFWIFASVSKWHILDQFTWHMNTQPLPNWMTHYLVWGLPILQLIIAFALIPKKTRLKALYGSLALTSLYFIYSVTVLAKVLGFVPCSCTWIHRDLSYVSTLLIEGALVILSFACIQLIKGRIKPPGSYDCLNPEQDVTCSYQKINPNLPISPTNAERAQTGTYTPV